MLLRLWTSWTGFMPLEYNLQTREEVIGSTPISPTNLKSFSSNYPLFLYDFHKGTPKVPLKRGPVGAPKGILRTDGNWRSVPNTWKQQVFISYLESFKTFPNSPKMSLKSPAKLCYEMVSNGLHDAEFWRFKESYRTLIRALQDSYKGLIRVL